jgi:hypothetical protein
MSMSVVNISARSPGILPSVTLKQFYERVKVSGPRSQDDYRVQRHKEKADAGGTSHERFLYNYPHSLPALLTNRNVARNGLLYSVRVK